MKIRRPTRWLLILVGLTAGWLAGGYLQATQTEKAAREFERIERESARPTTVPATAPTTGPVTEPSTGRSRMTTRSADRG